MFDRMNMQSKNGDGEKTIDLKEWMDQSENKYKETTLPALCVIGDLWKERGLHFPGLTMELRYRSQERFQMANEL